METQILNEPAAMEPSGKRADMMRLLKAEKPDLDTADDEAVFGLIIEDYADYARLLNDERGRLDKAASRKRKIEETREAFGAGHSPELAKAVREWLDKVAAAVEQGDYSAEAFEMAARAINYQRDVAAAELRGRNAQIRESIMAGQRGDGVPRLGASAPAPPSPPSIFDIARCG